jgi:hypothetical protein
MDAVLAILVLGAVIFFGALISASNERQRKALDGIREQAALWAMQDLRIKREKLARDVKVDDPIAWLNRVVAKVYGEALDLTMTEFFENPQALVCAGKDGRKVVFSPVSPDDIQQMKRESKSKLSRLGNTHPLIDLPREVEQIEISILNCGILFDLELSITWKLLTTSEISSPERLSMYLFT